MGYDSKILSDSIADPPCRNHTLDLLHKRQAFHQLACRSFNYRNETMLEQLQIILCKRVKSQTLCSEKKPFASRSLPCSATYMS